MITSRRNFLQVVGGTIVTSSFGAGCTPDPPPPPPPPPPPNVVKYTLAPQWVTKTMDGLTVRLRSYNGNLPGDTLTVSPGDRLEVTIDNQLTPYDSSAWDGNHNVPHDLNTTNLHLHGMAVIPHLFNEVGTSEAHSDMIAIEPGTSFTYVFDIPRDHPSGMYWYHPHHHGSTAVQAVSGMAGVIIVKGPIDDVPEIAKAQDVPMVISDIGLFESETKAGEWTYEPMQNAIWNTFGDGTAENPFVRMWDEMNEKWVARPDLKSGFTTGDYQVRFYCVDAVPVYREDHVGGKTPAGTQILPDGKKIDMQPGEVIRLRILNACSDLVMPLVFPDLDIHLIAMDGVPFTAPRKMKTVLPPDGQWDGVVDYNAAATSLVLAPGNRAELLLRAPDQAGTYTIVQLGHTGQQFLDAALKVLATITVAGDPKPMDLPKTLPGATRHQPPITQADISDTQSVMFTGRFDPEGMGIGLNNPVVGIDFSLNELQYDVHTINTIVKLGTSQEWTLNAMEHMNGNGEGHPFHIHVNSFEVKKIGNIDQPPGTIMDTVWVGMNQTVKVWMRFKQWTGKTVYHCHILPHEDTGMMANLLITEDLS
ncbi:multicopper oxidase domain-containing protein [Polyangium sp. 6x1]|uniref:multicopper oxidase family protein n=1 Tax=Polyangium sp. 6x1 TaxID=3042689 RepID=UPI0024827E45|nr:multicopper oxidase domain-containing protein [Polyangium sp. 6x1]MDI1445993.1 multicopper oxidase domain-containing protein [Polyangium sp. 6x1]